MNKGEIAIYQAPDGTASIDVKLEKESVWLNRQQMAELFGRDIFDIHNEVMLFHPQSLARYKGMMGVAGVKVAEVQASLNGTNTGPAL